MGWFHKYLCCHLRRHYSQLESVVIELRTCIDVCCCAISVQIPKTVFCYTSRKVVKILEQVLDVCDNFKIIYVVHSFSKRFDCHMSYPAMQTVYNSFFDEQQHILIHLHVFVFELNFKKWRRIVYRESIFIFLLIYDCYRTILSHHQVEI